ncbi:MAG: antitoxin family protein [Methanosarcinales archaeon Met12]|nr:MAG: antitoxin family protein [Methanosarcinales archaeon Met12]
MTKTIEVVYEKGVFKPLEKVEIREGERLRVEIDSLSNIVDTSFGLLKGKDTLKTLKELEDEWGFC